LFFIILISFFVFAISGLQLVAGGYVLAGVPALVVSGIVPLLSSFLNKRWNKSHSHGGEKKKKSKWDICDCLDLGDCGCGCD
jgi:hypothetical protein